MRAKYFAALVGGALVLAIGSPAAIAETFTCPQPQQINCVPAVRTVDGWRSNGGQMTGNSFAPNNQCGNVDTLGPNRRRTHLLLCEVRRFHP